MNKLFILLLLDWLMVMNGCDRDKQSIKSRNTSPNNLANTSLFLDTLNRDVTGHLIENSKPDNSGNFAWPPNAEEQKQFPISDDEKCHTALDTILFYDGVDSIKRAVVILRTYQVDRRDLKYGSHYEGSPVSVAIFKYSIDKRWELVKFTKKLISLGYYVGAEAKYKGFISLEKLNNGSTCLYFKQDPAEQQGWKQGFESLYYLDDFYLQREIFSQVFYNDYGLTGDKTRY